MGGTVQPFLKWAGGKRWLAQLNALPNLNEHGRYFEPFLGGAAMFFSLRPAAAILSDANADLIELYEVIRDEASALHEHLTRHQVKHSSEHYYTIRSSVPTCKLERASRMLYLNRTCWNGLYRVNSKGQFNVPKGTKSKVVMEDNFVAIAELLKAVEISACDFEVSIARAGAGDLVYADPPYTVRHNANGFLKYNERIFSWDDQVRLRDAAVQAAARGATVIVSNADHFSVHELYAEVAISNCFHRASVISGASSARGRTSEALFIINSPQAEIRARDPRVSILPGRVVS